MRVTIEHREQAAGRRHHYFVDCTVAFSEEEKAIVKVRGLENRRFEVPAATAKPSLSAQMSTGFLRAGGVLLMIGSAITGVIMGFAGSGDGPTVFLFIIGAGMAVYGWVRDQRQANRLADAGQIVTIGHLLSRASFSVHADDPSEAKAVDDLIRRHLADVKELLSDSADLATRQTFEL
jgi:hypothetical protein